MAKKQQLKYKQHKNAKYGFVNGQGQWVISPQFDDAWNFNDGVAMVELKSKYGYIKMDGSYLFEPQFDSVNYFKDGIATVKIKNKYGCIKIDGSYLFEPQFDDINRFENGIAKIKLNDKYGFIKADGSFIAMPQFDRAYDFEKGKAMVLLEGKWFDIKSDGILEEMSNVRRLVLSCDEMQNENSPGWSFLEASVKNDKWEFKSWARIMDDNDEWYDDRYYIEDLIGDLIRYYDEVEENKSFAKWANSLNLSTPEDVGELLWANAQQLIDDAKIKQDSGGYNAPLRDLTILIQLYWQLKNIEELGLQDVRNSLDLPKENDLCLNSQKVKRKAIKFCAELLTDDDGFEELDFTDLTEKSRKPGEYNLVSCFEGGEEGEEDDDDDWDEDEDRDD